MRIIFTKEDKKIARKRIENFRKSYVINARELILEFDYLEGDVIDSPYDFIINKELEKKLYQAITNRRSTQVIYFHYNITKGLLSNVREFFEMHGSTNVEYLLFDADGSLQPIHEIFDEVIK
jgi:hypothetical protein